MNVQAQYSQHNNYTQRLAKIEDQITCFLPNSINTEWANSMFGSGDHFSESDLQNLVKPCRDLLLSGGKRWRPLLLVLCAELLVEQKTNLKKNASGDTLDNSIVDTAYKLVPIIELVHTASLIHDDIEDNADIRRGKPAAHVTYGKDVAINSATWLYFAALETLEQLDIAESDKLSFYKICITEIRRLHLGQSMDISWHKQKNYVPTKDEYMTMVGLKTGTLAVLAAKLGAICGKASEDELNLLSTFAKKAGMGFQILDDVINLTTGNKGKKRGDDIIEGKKSLPLILHLEKQKNDLPKVIECFEKASLEGLDSPAIETLISLLNSTDSIQEAKKIATSLITESRNIIIESFPNSKVAPQIASLFSSMI